MWCRADSGWDGLRGGLEVRGKSEQDFLNCCRCRVGADKKFQPAQDSSGYTSVSHNSARGSKAQIMREACRDVQTEPTLLPINKNDYETKINTADNVRLDISVRGLWNRREKTFFNVRITHPTSHSQSYSGKSLAEIYQQHKRGISTTKEWLIGIEKSSFNPLVVVFTSGGMAPECMSQQKTGRKNS